MVSSVIRKIRQNDHYEVNLQNSRVPNSTVSEKLILSMILEASEEELSVKAKKDLRPRRHQGKGRRSQESRGRTKSSWDFFEDRN